MKTFVTKKVEALMKSYIDNSSAIVRRIGEQVREALTGITNLFKDFDLKTIDVENYDPEYAIAIEDDYGNVNLVPVKCVDVWEGYVYVIDREGYEHGAEEWSSRAPELLSELSLCLDKKLKDIQELKVGARVRWINPGIEDYPEEEREEMLQLIWVIDSCPDEIEEDSVIAISNEYGEAEVLPMELVIYRDEE